MSDKPQAAYAQKVTVTFTVLFTGDHEALEQTTVDELSDRATKAVRAALPPELGEAVDELYAPRFADSRRYFFPGEEPLASGMPLAPLKLEVE